MIDLRRILLRSRRGVSVFWLAVAGVAVLGLLVVALAPSDDRPGGGSAASVVNEAYAAVVVDGEALPKRSGGEDEATGRVAPQITGRDFADRSVRIGGPREAPQLVVFVAHWCPHCQVEVPRLVEWMRQRGDDLPLDVTAVVTASSRAQPNWPPSDWLHEERWDAPVLLDDEVASAASAYGVDAFPYFTLIGRDGQVLARDSGELTEAQLDQLAERASGSES